MTSSASLSARLRSGETIRSAWSTISDPLLLENISALGFDAVTMDMQHGSHTESSICQGIGTVKAAGKPVIVRIPVGRFDTASRALDFGANAVIAPMINSAEEARAFAASMKYPPVGERSWGPLRSEISYGQPGSNDYLLAANQETLSFAMIETRAAFEALDAILAVRGIDGVFVGPADFSIAWSNGREANPFSEAIVEPLTQIAKKAAASNKLAGIYAPNSAFAKRYQALGFSFVTLASDRGYLAAGASAMLNAWDEV
ncbi:HpcH/HpaI aldolase/citrate lyase family protein [Pseudochrobactrum sp. sp1633]|uniref:HpcH/HpaI aldolase family protein n=1 Tax=Pseudochrobactrum sp. sp1633 TaxID=3036706 RepID=UPI0025A5C662|nr:HpcH/HpaI aldolase/citrate lyase family protein [Pseudochrobactrum sp. sp1633]MDM8343951.1 HpcH/HpaI aldolase/citrate lyase family protein [Pseudochrobactrum sp. sp1633]HWD11924.1 HpcH/HpaI aldolase/citrate lyase family protein [Pseudochrobactrum sp.]